MCDNRGDRAKQDLIDACRTRYKDDIYEQNRITEFEQTYKTGQAIHWYTKDSFLYRCLNRAFRTLDIDVIYRFRFIIAELHEQLDSLTRASTSDLVVYRGQIISTKDMKLIERYQGKGFIAMNTFLSTSENPSHATGYSSVNMDLPEGLESVLFQIDVRQTRQPFANIDKLSAMPKEKEILFSAGTVFRIDEVENYGIGYDVHLTSTTEIEERFDALFQHYLDEIGAKPTLATLGKFLMMKGDYNRAEHYFQFLIDENELELDNGGRAICYMNLGRISDEKEEHERALNYYYQVLTVQQSTLPKDHIHFSTTYNNIGAVQMVQGQYKEAIENFQHSLDIDLSHQNVEPIMTAKIYSNMGQAYAEIRDYAKAIEYSEKSLKIELQNNRNTMKHPSIAIEYHNLGLLYEEMNQHEKAIEYYEKAITIQKASLPPEHPSTIISESDLANAYFQSGQRQLGLKKCLKVLDAKLKQRSLNFPSLAKSYINLGTMYEDLGRLNKAEENLKKSLHICKRYLTNHHPDITTTYQMLGDVYDGMGKRKKALTNYQLSLEVYERRIPLNLTAMANVYIRMSAVEENSMKAIDYGRKGVSILLDADKIDKEALAFAYNALGSTLLKAKQIEEAMINCTKALDLGFELVNGDTSHPSLNSYYHNLGAIYSQQGELEKALEYQQKALEIFIKKVEDPQHPETGQMYNNLAITYHELKKYQLALEFFEKAINSFKQPSAENPRLLAQTYINIGSVYEDLDEWQKEAEYYKMALDVQLTQLEPDDADLVLTYSSLAAIYENRENYATTLDYLVPMLNIQTEILSKYDLELADTHERVGTCYHLTKNYKKALKHYRKVLKIQRRQREPLTSIYQSLGNTYRELKQRKTASKYYQMAIEIINEKDETSRTIDEHADLCQLYRRLGIIERQLKQFDKAMAHLKQSLALYDKFLANDNQYNELVRGILESMAKVHEATGNMSLAEECR
ncbi:unnamed protein product [Rotaria sp. Silwood2]|nr:unnamed protein product [Rotaria sp. Silwood2]CAF4346134.1 unnamed protein product [Rotaria sp. Silwood2]